jgi:hypothetical protein
MNRNSPPKSPFSPFAAFAPPSPSLASLFTANPMFAMFGQAGEAYARACQVWQQEMIRTAVARFESNSAFGQRLAQCQSWQEATQVQQEWAAAVTQDFMQEATRMGELASTLGSEIGAGLTPGAAPAPSTARKTDAA